MFSLQGLTKTSPACFPRNIHTRRLNAVSCYQVHQNVADPGFSVVVENPIGRGAKLLFWPIKLDHEGPHIPRIPLGTAKGLLKQLANLTANSSHL